jgi:hypothetical protein
MVYHEADNAFKGKQHSFNLEANQTSGLLAMKTKVILVLKVGGIWVANL